MRPVIAIALFTLLGSVLPSSAWNGLGHKTVAELAWRKLDNSERKAITTLLQQHPHYDRLLAVGVPKDMDPDKWAYLNGAVWPDQIRPAPAGSPSRPVSVTKYNLYYHAILLPVIRNCDTNEVTLGTYKLAPENAETGLTNSLAVLQNKKASAHDRAVALTWILHLFGDIHQPLHASTLITKQKPKGNAAGSNLLVRDLDDREIGLHAFWDGLAGPSGDYTSVIRFADELEARPELRKKALPEYKLNRTALAWAREGQLAAASFAYSEKHITFVQKSDVDSGKIRKADIPKMSADYAATAEKVAERRLALAAWRLADALKKAF